MVRVIRKILFDLISKTNILILRKVYGMHIGDNVRISRKARLDKSINPQGIYIGNNSWVLSNAVILSHDHSKAIITETKVGDNCILGISSIILPGIKVGNHVVVGAGSVVTKDIDDHSLVVGNPARVIKTGISVDNNGRII